LNGTSSAGKSTLAWKLQEYLEQDYYWLSNDAFSDMPHNKQYDRDRTGTFRTAITMLYRTVRLFVEDGKNVIIDHVMTYDDKGDCEELFDCAKFMQGIPVLFVFVSCPLEELNRREIARGDRIIGNAEGQFHKLLPADTYDLVVDTYANTTEKCAELIIDKQKSVLSDPNYVTAFDRILMKKSASSHEEGYKWIQV
jgi:chloramphenicol 3-O phosphotransferase